MEAAAEISPDIETQLLLQNQNNNNNNGNGEDSSKAITASLFRVEAIWEEVKKQVKLAGPLITYNLLLFALQVVSVMFVGHLGELPLSGASMATSFAAVTGFSLMRGMANALDTFCGQSYGAKQYHLLGIQMQRGMVVLVAVCIPVALIWGYTGQILALMGQDPEISASAGVYALHLIPSLFACGILQCILMFLQAQNNVFPMLPIAGFSTVLHIFFCWLLVFKLQIGHRGAAMSTCVSYWLNVLLLSSYVKFSPSCKHTWTGFSTKAFDIVGIFEFLKLAVPSAIMTCLEIWSFEMMVLLAGFLPNPTIETSVLSISLNTETTLLMIPLGFGGATSTRVGNELGAGRPYAARFAILVSMMLANIEGILAALILILGRNFWGYCYSNVQEIVSYVGQMLLLVALSHFLDGIKAVSSGAVRGCGFQKIGAYVNLGAYYLVGFPCALLLAFYFHFGGKGLWIGITIAIVVQGFCQVVIILRTNWEIQAKKATERVNNLSLN